MGVSYLDSEIVKDLVSIAFCLEAISDKEGCTTRYVDLEGKPLSSFLVSGIVSGKYFYKLANDIKRNKKAEIFKYFESDLKDSLQYLNKDNLKIFPHEITGKIEKISKMTDYEVNENHRKVTSIILEDLKKKDFRLLTENITRAGFIRGFLG